MKTTLKSFVLSALVFLFMVPSMARDDGGSSYSSPKDSAEYIRTLSFYKEFYKIKLYTHAIVPWWDLFHKYPAQSESIYIDGVKMYRAFIEDVADAEDREFYLDTLMHIYDQRMEYFGGEGNVLGRKGIDLLKYGGSNMDRVEQAYRMLGRSLELEGKNSRETVILNFISAGLTLNKKNRIEDIRLVEDYFDVLEIIDQNKGGSSRWARVASSIDDMMSREDKLNCETLNLYFEPRFDKNQGNEKFLHRIITSFTAAGCESSGTYLAASEKLYHMAPEARDAYKLAKLHTARGDYSHAITYLKAAVQGEGIEDDTRAEWLYKLSVVSLANKNYCEAISHAREAILLKENYGKAYMILGDAMVAYGYILEDEFEQRAAFWAASDKYSKASSLDPSLSEEANKKLNEYRNQYPDREEIFFRDLKEGASYRVKGCINENTTVLARK